MSGSGERVRVRDLAVSVDPVRPQDRQSPAQPPFGFGMIRLRRVTLRRDDQEAGRPAGGALTDPRQQRLADHGLVRNHQHVLRSPLRFEVDDHVLDRNVPGRLTNLVDDVLAQPA